MIKTIIVAAASNGVIGDGARIPWRLPADLKRFKQLTMGHWLVMGRKTFESIGRPLPGRTTVVVTRGDFAAPEGVRVAHSIDEALALAQGDEVFICGGAEIYRQTLQIADRVHFTRIEQAFEGDVVFPDVDWSTWRVAARERHEATAEIPFAYEFIDYEK